MLASESVRPVGIAASDPVKHRPVCPNCGRPMHLTRITPRSGGLTDLRTYGCGECGVWATQAADQV